MSHRSPLFKKIIAASISLLVSSAFAGSFQLWEESAASTGDYHAGAAAEANDASTEFYNPAGMVRIKKPEVSTGFVYIPLRVKFNGTVYTASAGTPPIPSDTNGYVSGNSNKVVPNFHLVLPLNHQWAIGLGVTTPFGLETDYPIQLPLSAAATRTSLKTINVNPNIAYAITPKFSIGAGIDALYGDAKYNMAFDATKHLNNQLSGWGYGWNAGALYQMTPNTRFGLSYRSDIVLHGHGTSTETIIAPTESNSNLSANLHLPGSIILSAFSALTPKWDVLGSIYYTRWSLFHNLQLENLAAIPGVVPSSINDVFDYHDSINVVLGVHYHINKKWMVKGGVAWDQTPTRDGYRDVRLPDANRYVVALGVHWQVTPSVGWDVGAAHLFTGHIKIDNSRAQAPTPGFINIYEVGTVKANINVVGTQLTFTI